MTSSTGSQVDFTQEGLSISSSGTQLSSMLIGCAILISSPQDGISNTDALSAYLTTLKTLQYYNYLNVVSLSPRTITFAFTDLDGSQTVSDVVVSYRSSNATSVNCSQRSVDVVLIIDSATTNSVLPFENITSIAAGIIQQLPLGVNTIRFVFR